MDTVTLSPRYQVGTRWCDTTTGAKTYEFEAGREILLEVNKHLSPFAEIPASFNYLPDPVLQKKIQTKQQSP